MLSEFAYDTNTDADNAIARSFAGISSLGLSASLTLAGPDGQLNGGETFTISGAGAPIVLSNTWDGNVPQSGPSFAIGNLWDNDTYDVSAFLPAGQTTLAFDHARGRDCIGVGAAVLQVRQSCRDHRRTVATDRASARFAAMRARGRPASTRVTGRPIALS